MSAIDQIQRVASQFGIKWKSPLSGLTIAVLSGLAMVIGSLKLFDSSLTLTLAIGGTTFLVAGGFWLFTCRVPGNIPGHIGIALAITTETEDERKRIRTDFIKEIELSLNRTEAITPFCVVEIPGYLAPDINDTEEAVEFLRKSRCQLLIWGGIRTRKTAKGDVYAMRLEGVVTHPEVRMEVSQSLAREMRLTIPDKLEITLTNELKGFESASNSIALATKYVVALVAALSGDLHFSKLMLHELDSGLRKKRIPKKGPLKSLEEKLINHLKAVLPRRLAEVCYAECQVAIADWQSDKENLQLLQKAEVHLEEFRRRQTEFEKIGAQYWVTKALLEVTLRNDFKKADTLLHQCKLNANADSVWRLSRAFVKMILAEEVEAMSLYDTAFKRDIPSQSVLQVEDYVQWWLQKNQGPPSLYLLSAMLNFRAKNDVELALEDLAKFEATVNSDTSKLLVNRAAALRRDIKVA